MTTKKTPIVTKVQLKLGQNSKTQIVTELQNSNCDQTLQIKWQRKEEEKNSNCDITQKFK